MMLGRLEHRFYAGPMRWDHLRLDEPESESEDGAASGAGEGALFDLGAVARTFDTPGFRGMPFYEVHAKSIVNRVPAGSRMAFTWTINPYRGCQHSCVYCLAGDTPILTADGSTKPLRDVRVGDKIYGTVRSGGYRRYAITTVLAHWSTVKPAYRITLADGTQVIASGDHRFLTERGWKHVTGAEQGPGQRPFLTSSNKLMGTGEFAEPPKATDDYRRGYLCGMIRGDGLLRGYRYGRGEVHQFRLALADEEGLRRTRDYLDAFGIPTSERAFPEELIAWPAAPRSEWQKGFLAGIFDAEGSYGQGVWRVSSTDPEIIDSIIASLAALGFDYVLAPLNQPNGPVVVR